MKNFIQNKNIKTIDYFAEFRGTIVKVATKFVENESYYVYKGVLDGKSAEFIYLRDCEVVRVANGKEVEKSRLGRVALNKAIVSWVDFS